MGYPCPARIDYRSWSPGGKLGRLYAQAGRLSEAIETTRRALAVALQASDERLARDLRGRLSSHEAVVGGSQDTSARTRSR